MTSAAAPDLCTDLCTDLCAASAQHLARFLRARAEDESVRTLEALAAAIRNRVHQRLMQPAASADLPRPSAAALRAKMLITALQQMQAPAADVAEPADPDDPVFACCLRIARRAMNGALADPTRGATAFRKLGDPLPEALDREVGMWIGSYVFFTEAENRPQPAAAIGTEALSCACAPV